MIETLDIETLDLRRQEQEEFLAERRLSGVAQSSWRQRSAHTVQSAWATRLAPDTQAALRAAAVLAEAVTEAALTAVADLPRAGCALVSAERPREPATPWPPNPGRNTGGPIRALATIMSEWRPRWCRAEGGLAAIPSRWPVWLPSSSTRMAIGPTCSVSSPAGAGVWC